MFILICSVKIVLEWLCEPFTQNAAKTNGNADLYAIVCYFRWNRQDDGEKSIRLSYIIAQTSRIV